MRSRTMLKMIMVLFCAVSAASCATTDVKTVWKDEAYKSQPKKVLVISMFKNQSVRRMTESEFRDNLKHRKTDAAAGFDTIPGNEIPAKEIVVEQLKAGGFDALLLMRLVDVRSEQHAVQSTPVYSAPYGVPMGGYYGRGYNAVYAPSYMVEDRFATVEANLYDVASEKLVWSATSDTWLNVSQPQAIKTFVAVMMESLRKQKIVP